MLKLILGRAGCGKTTTVLKRLCQAGQERRQVLMVPEQQSHQAERALCKAGGDEVSLYAEVLSFSRLANRVFLAAGGVGEPELDSGGRLLLMYQAVKAVSQELTVYARPSRRPAFLENLLATVDELKSCCVQPQLLLQAGEEVEGPEGDKLRDLGLICGAYQALTARTALDPRDRLTRTAEKLSACPWAQDMDLWLDGFTDFTPQQGEVLAQLMAQAHQIIVTLTCDHLEEDEGGTGIFSPARRQVAEPLELLRKNTNKTGEGQAIALYGFLENIGLPERLEEQVAALRQREQPALAEEYRQLWEIVCGGLEQCAQLLGETPMELEEFAALFRLVLSQYDVGTIPVSLDRVTAGETTRQTGQHGKVLFLLGADDASIPQVSTPAGLLSDDDRSLLASYGLELNQTARDLLYREMTTVYLTCARPTQKLIVSWPGQSGAGEERRPCFLVERLRLLFSDLTVEREEDLYGRFRLQAPLPALEQAGRSQSAHDALLALPEYAPMVERLDRAARWERGRLSRPAVERLYGHRVPMSASRMDKYKSCHFSYFMRYGLQAEPRKPAGFTAPEYGTFVHYVLEHVLKDDAFQQTTLPGWEDEQDQERRDRVAELTRQAVEQYVREELGGLEQQSERFQYLFRRLLRSVQAVVDNVTQEIWASKFRPISFELGFGNGKDLPPVELTVGDVTLSITGFVDRVDGWEKDGRLYLRVVDYKTGRKSFDLTEVWNGLGLQMLLYLFTLENRGEKFYGKPVEGAGVLYLPARDAIIKGSRSMSDDAWRKQLDKELTRSGLVLSDPAVLDAMEEPGEKGYRFLPLKVSKSTGEISGEALATAEQLGKLGGHIQKVLEEICEEIAQGNIAADPFWRGPEKNACRYCDYAQACHFEEGRGGDGKRWLASVKSREFWENVAREEN